MTFIYEACLEEFLDNPPACLDVVVVQCDIRVLHIGHICHTVTHLLPHVCVCEYGLPALFVEFFDAVFFDVLLAGHFELLFDFDFNRQSVSIPACLTVHLITLHCLVTVYGVLEGSCHYVMYARFAVGRRRTFIEVERRHTLSC